MRRSLACLVLALAVAAGCGGSGGSKTTASTAPGTLTNLSGGATPPDLDIKGYQRQVVDAISQMGVFAGTLAKVRPGNLKSLAPAFATQAAAFSRAAADVESLTPPAKLKAAHAHLVQALRAVSKAMGELGAAAQKDDAVAFLQADDAFVRAADEVAKAGQALQGASG